MNNIIEDLRISPLKETNYIKPLKVNFTLNGIKKSWEAVRSHDSVAVLLYHKEKESFLFVKQFRVPVYLNDKNITYTYFRFSSSSSAALGVSLAFHVVLVIVYSFSSSSALS